MSIAYLSTSSNLYVTSWKIAHQRGSRRKTGFTLPFSSEKRSFLHYHSWLAKHYNDNKAQNVETKKERHKQNFFFLYFYCLVMLDCLNTFLFHHLPLNTFLFIYSAVSFCSTVSSVVISDVSRNSSLCNSLLHQSAMIHSLTLLIVMIMLNDSIRSSWVVL